MASARQQLQPSVCIRRCRPADDAQAVRNIFVRGIWDTGPPLRKEAWSSPTWHGKLLRAASVAVPAAALSALRRSHSAVQLLGVLASTLLVPAYVYAHVFSVDAAFINKCLKNDLADISGTYDTGDGSAFWVAECEGKVVGCIGLQEHTKQVAEVTRMSVCQSLRGRGIATALCKELISHACKQGFKEIFLWTTSSQYAALAVYQKLGFVLNETHEPHLLKWVKLTLSLP